MFLKNVQGLLLDPVTHSIFKISAKSYSEKVGELQFTAIHRLSVDEIL